MKKLDLNAIADEVLDECFASEEVNVLEAIDAVEEEHDDHKFEKPNTGISLTRPKGVTNEMLIQEVRDGINVEKNIDLLVRYNYPMIVSTARKCTCFIPFEDKISYGVEGLMRAIHTFDPTKNVKFITYATTTVYMTIYNESADANYLVHFPRYMSVNNIYVKRCVEAYQKKYGRFPTPEMVAEETGIEIQHVKNCLTYTNTYMALDMKLSTDSESTLSDIVTTVDPDYNLGAETISIPLVQSIADMMHNLSEKDRELIERVHGIGSAQEPETLREIIESGFEDEKGKVITARSSLHRKYSDAMERLRKMVKSRGYEFEDF
ncbi:hypothetical protein [Escherichia phage vB_EcoM_JNE01]|nr:hypothetical protein [Escherichia phage vB_EcoM_JNE01]